MVKKINTTSEQINARGLQMVCHNGHTFGGLPNFVYKCCPECGSRNFTEVVESKTERTTIEILKDNVETARNNVTHAEEALANAVCPNLCAYQKAMVVYILVPKTQRGLKYTASQLFYALALGLLERENVKTELGIRASAGNADSQTFAGLDPGFRILLPENKFEAAQLVQAAGIAAGESIACDTLEMILKEKVRN